MKDLSKIELLPIAQVYFNNPERSEIFATSDRQFFDGEFDARKYCLRNEKEYYKIVREDYNEEKPEKAEVSNEEKPKKKGRPKKVENSEVKNIKE